MKISKIISYILNQLKYFFINPFWQKWQVLLTCVISFAAAAMIWFLYFEKYKDFLNFTPIAFSGGVLLINLFLAVISYPKEKNISYILVGTGLLVQLFILFFIKITVLSGLF